MYAAAPGRPPHRQRATRWLSRLSADTQCAARIRCVRETHENHGNVKHHIQSGGRHYRVERTSSAAEDTGHIARGARDVPRARKPQRRPPRFRCRCPRWRIDQPEREVPMNISRRRLFAIAGAAGVAARFGKTADTDPAQMIVRSPRPTDLEMCLAGFNDEITPIERFFVRTHTYTPQVDGTAWNLKVEGTVGRPLTLTMAELKKLPHVDMVSVAECAGNGRSFYRPRVPGAQWEYGSLGNARWTGVRLKDVLAKAGVKDGSKHVLFDGADEPIGKMEDFRRSITIEKALDPDTMLAFEMNGQELPVQHGFPL